MGNMPVQVALLRVDGVERMKLVIEVISLVALLRTRLFSFPEIATKCGVSERSHR